MNRIVYALGWLWIYGFVIAARVADSFGGFRYEQLSFVLIVIQLLLWVSGRVATTKVSPREWLVNMVLVIGLYFEIMWMHEHAAIAL